ncbi:hypothetical protein Dsin_002372 [Dipteronia sinensis]|uniref:Reverse transcriptase n=1 Tax=Dipteronia sinensis TaxID=43782 RepID=A0AAE0B643_9ROSI|nr:hypothetical protein Dsin_002372 [Dipteronia sinensis]
MNFMKDFHEDGSIVKELNYSFITLIPKIGNPETIKDFRPISLVGSMYKILTNVLANRIKKVMDSAIGESQMSFVKGKHISDAITWSGRYNGMFTVSSIRQGLVDSRNAALNSFKDVWQGICTPKIEFFMWQLIMGKVLVKDTMQIFCLDYGSNTKCPNCDSGMETADHVFLLCCCLKQLWDVFIGWWGISWCCNNFFKDWFDSWSGQYGAVGIGGVLRDSKCKVLCLFTQSVGTMDSNLAEILAIKRASQLCFSQQGLHYWNVIIINVSKSDVPWVNGGDFGCMKHVDIIWEIRNLIQCLGNLTVVPEGKAFNAFADSLAKQG